MNKFKVNATVDVILEPSQLDKILRDVLSRDYMQLCEDIGRSRKVLENKTSTDYYMANIDDQVKFRDSILGALQYYLTPAEHRKLREAGGKASGE